ncbi:MAG: hypothetical protein NTAFB05_20250 [Nitrobacter sp.]
MIMRKLVLCPGPGSTITPAAEPLGDKVVDDMKAKAGAALVAAPGEGRIEGPPPDVRRHADAIVGKNDLDVILGAGLAAMEIVPDRPSRTRD